VHAFAELFWFTSLRPGMAMTAVLGTCEEVQLHELVNPDADKCIQMCISFNPYDSYDMERHSFRIQYVSGYVVE